MPNVKPHATITGFEILGPNNQSTSIQFLKNRKSNKNLFEISGFIQRLVLSKMKQKINMSPGFLRFYDVF